MDVVLIAAAGVLAPFLVFALWRLIPSDRDVSVVAGSTGPARSDLAEKRRRNPRHESTRIEPTGTPMSRPILAEHPDERVAVGPGKGSVEDVDPKEFEFDGLSFPGRPAVRQSKPTSRSRSQWPARAAVAGCRCHEWLHPSQFSAGLFSMPGFSVAGSNVLPRLRAEARERLRHLSLRAGAGARRGVEQPPKKAVGSRTQRSPRFGKELAALAATSTTAGWRCDRAEAVVAR